MDNEHLSLLSLLELTFGHDETKLAVTGYSVCSSLDQNSKTKLIEVPPAAQSNL